MPLEDSASSLDGESLRFNQHTSTDNVWATSFTSGRRLVDRDNSLHKRQRSVDGLKLFGKDGASADEDTGSKSKAHARSRTDVGTSLAQASQHPLRSPRQLHVDESVTRPTLRKLVDDWDATVSRSSRPKDKKKDDDEQPRVRRDPAREEIEVIVHEVSGKDSLAGVALKYGVSLATLRRANQMWAGDTIHSRKVLYIPVKGMHYIPTQAAIESDSEVLTAVSATISASIPSSVMPLPSRTYDASVPSPVRRRIPIHRLSYFPPPTEVPGFFSSSLRPNNLSAVAHAGSPPQSTHSSPHPSPGVTLTTLFTSFPLPEAITNRISLDSSREGSVDLTDNPALEMNDMVARVQTSSTHSGLALKSGYGMLNETDTSNLSKRSVVRTSQLEPSAGMKLPSNLGSSRRGDP